MKLYELTEAMTAFLAAVEAGEIPDEAIADTLEGLELAFDEKIDECAAAYKGILAEAQDIKEEADKLIDRYRRKQAEADRLGEYIKMNLERLANGGKPAKFETARSVISFRKTSSVAVFDENAVMEACKASPALSGCVTYKEPTLNRTALKQAISGGQDIPGVKIDTGYSMSIK